MDLYSYHQDVVGPDSKVDLTHYDVEATDGHIGKVDAASYVDTSSCFVVDTGHWIFGKRRMIPVGVVRRIDHNRRLVQIAMSKEEVKAAPDFSQELHDENEHSYYEAIGEYYEPFTFTG